MDRKSKRQGGKANHWHSIARISVDFVRHKKREDQRGHVLDGITPLAVDQESGERDADASSKHMPE